MVTAGAEPLAARGICSAEVEPPEVEMVSPLGSGDVFMGTLAAGLMGMGADWDADAVPALLERAAAAGAEACTRLGAFEP